MIVQRCHCHSQNVLSIMGKLNHTFFSDIIFCFMFGRLNVQFIPELQETIGRRYTMFKRNNGFIH